MKDDIATLRDDKGKMETLFQRIKNETITAHKQLETVTQNKETAEHQLKIAENALHGITGNNPENFRWKISQENINNEVVCLGF